MFFLISCFKMRLQLLACLAVGTAHAFVIAPALLGKKVPSGPSHVVRTRPAVATMDGRVEEAYTRGNNGCWAGKSKTRIFPTPVGLLLTRVPPLTKQVGNRLLTPARGP